MSLRSLVDNISGSYTFAKTQIFAKRNLDLAGRERGEVMVIPPKEREERFVKAMDRHFVRLSDRSIVLEYIVEGGAIKRHSELVEIFNDKDQYGLHKCGCRMASIEQFFDCLHL